MQKIRQIVGKGLRLDQSQSAFLLDGSALEVIGWQQNISKPQ